MKTEDWKFMEQITLTLKGYFHLLSFRILSFTAHKSTHISFSSVFIYLYNNSP